MMKGKIVLVPFPFDDLSANKVRPAVCLTNPVGGRRQVILACITSRIPTNLFETDILLDANHPDFAGTGLKQASIVRLHQLVTISTVVVLRQLGELSSDTQADIANKLQYLLTK